LRNPNTTRVETERFVASFVRPHGISRPATPIFADTIERLGHAPASPPEHAPAWRYLVHPLLLVAELPVLAVDQWRAARFKWLRKRLATFVHRTRKRVVKAGARWKRYVEGVW